VIKDLDQVLASLARQLARQAAAVAPFMPAKAEELWSQLGGPGSVADARIQLLNDIDPTGWTVKRAGPLFPKEENATA
jgi:methionyl-tRNA synthetase